MRPPSELAAVLAGLPPSPFDGALFRAAHLEALYGFHLRKAHARPEPLFSLGAARKGARFTPIGGPPSLYMAGDPETALLEANRGSVHLLPPTVVFSAQVRLNSVLDLTQEAIQKALETDTGELTEPWRLRQKRKESVFTQVLGLAVHQSDLFAAIRYPSATSPGRICYAILCDRVVAPCFVLVHDPQGNLVGRIP